MILKVNYVILNTNLICKYNNKKYNNMAVLQTYKDIAVPLSYGSGRKIKSTWALAILERRIGIFWEIETNLETTFLFPASSHLCSNNIKPHMKSVVAIQQNEQKFEHEKFWKIPKLPTLPNPTYSPFSLLKLVYSHSFRMILT